MSKYIYGWKPDKLDHRDKVRRFGDPEQAQTLPPSTDLTSFLPSCYDQGDLGSCTANAIAGAVEFDLKKQSKPLWVPSRLFIYYNERMLEGTIFDDAGAEIRDGIKTINRYGVCQETQWPYIETRFAKKPSSLAYSAARLEKALQYHSLQSTSLQQLRACLASGFPFVMGFTVFEALESDEMADATNPILPMPSPSDQPIGGHAVLAVGYDDEKSAFLIRNSWGPNWCQDGHFWMPYSYATDKNLADDFWTIQSIS